MVLQKTKGSDNVYFKVELTLTTDIMAEFKHRLFTTVPDELGLGSHLIVLTDIEFWNKNYDELIDWCNLYNVSSMGMTVQCKSEEQVALFVLRWM